MSLQFEGKVAFITEGRYITGITLPVDAGYCVEVALS